MFSKIAINNVKRSFRDYAIYFLTLTLGVCIFYSFNSIESQGAIQEFSKSPDFKLSMQLSLAAASVFVSFVLGGLVIFANNFLIKKRKKELGIYMTLGMPKGKISQILIFESLLIGVLSLAAGLGLGVLVSQSLSIVTSSILSVNVDTFEFVFSPDAMWKSILYFGVIFVVVMLFNQFTVSKYKLIDLLNAAKKNENVKLKNPFTSFLLFLFSGALLGFAYSRALKDGLNASNPDLVLTIVLGVAGTLFFFFSLSSFFVQLVQRNKRVYFKGINIFVLRQLNNKINTNFFSMTVMCLLLFLTITLIFTSFDLKGTIDETTVTDAPFDASAFLFVDEESENPAEIEIEAYLNEIDFAFDAPAEHAFYSEYELDMTTVELLAAHLSGQEKLGMQADYMDNAITAVKAADYNEMQRIKGQDPVQLGEDEVLIVSNFHETNDALTSFLDGGDKVMLQGREYAVKNSAPIEENLKINGYSNFFHLILPDSFDGELRLIHTGFNVVYDEAAREEAEETFSDLFYAMDRDEFRGISPALVIGATLDQENNRAVGAMAIIVFLGLFMGLIFIISSATVMALQQLSDASDSLERYRSLRKIGVTEKMINGAILKQCLIYFLVPLSLAIVHSIVGISSIEQIMQFHYESILFSILPLVLIYSGYFYATYAGVKNIVKSN
ncbi:FtsX-like permease family protein [Planomicrobium sp. YIM 101495]|uniref:FtsX-like permease family protein n=1 Tax=Planomicrobium sp. YIM 101495 TaxID=2665160 RepID=UPI0012B99426|nr:ABC transporter permease [Planomicrobium sp. YIM 101495]MTD32062.1 FtsX-like permease family protein [Planomicrobium sp. YIM 101495]